MNTQARIVTITNGDTYWSTVYFKAKYMITSKKWHDQEVHYPWLQYHNGQPGSGPLPKALNTGTSYQLQLCLGKTFFNYFESNIHNIHLISVKTMSNIKWRRLFLRPAMYTQFCSQCYKKYIVIIILSDVLMYIYTYCNSIHRCTSRWFGISQSGTSNLWTYCNMH